MRKTRVRKQKNKRHTRKKQHLRKTHIYKRVARLVKGGAIDTPMVGSLEGEDHKGLGKMVVAGPLGVMSGKAYLQTMENMDQQGLE